jgi:hypothetical protein
MRTHVVVFLDVERHEPADVATLASEWRKSH